MAETAETLLAKDDDALRDMFGLNSELKEIKEYLADAAKLEGKAKTIFERELANMLSPEVSGSRMRYAIEDAKRAAMTPKEKLDDDAPTSVL